MAKKRPKLRTLQMQDGGWFRIGPNTITVDVSQIPWAPPAETLHIGTSCGCLELPTLHDGTELLALRLPADAVVELVELVNNERFRASVKSKRHRPENDPIVLPKALLRLAAHAAAVPPVAMPFAGESLGYPGTNDRRQTLWVHRTTGAAMMETDTTPPVAPRTVGGTLRTHTLERLSSRRAVAWLAANGYRAIPATLHRVARLGVDDDAPDTDDD
jgi:hypothetical protein